jgi:hypothetical protein
VLERKSIRVFALYVSNREDQKALKFEIEMRGLA